MGLNAYLKKIKEAVDSSLDRYLPPATAYPSVIHTAMRYSVFSGGKRIRPILAIESCRACGGSQRLVMPAACAIELIHNYSLIHDDLPAMDDDDYRRGRPASHRVFGEANAILAGDALLTLAFNILAGTPEKEAALRAVEVLSRAAGTEGLIGGQVLDLAFQGKKKSGKVARYVDSHKTGALFGASTAIGAIVAGAGAREEKALAEFGRLLGISFQLIDDMIDAEGAGRVFEKRARKKAGDCMRRAKGCLRVLGGGAERLAQIGDSLLQRVD